MKSLGQVVVSVIVVAGFVGILFLLIVFPFVLSDNLFNLLLVLVGTLAAKFGDVVQFYVGSSASSRDKDEALKDIAKSTTSTEVPPTNGTGGR